MHCIYDIHEGKKIRIKAFMRERPLYPCVNLFIWPLWPENFNPLPLRVTVIYFLSQYHP